ncbi:Spx/MgsR family RNA polymerase-binding regulatory protein [Alkalicoccus luteus]|uniref:Spx/MgsR family RNA polymerase-binding regulatory protein n=1 Tax=Alkalicoccus luteus TaxID=1237094 RepID=A0A969PVJ9_9BACI|nr:Spx/MgsR family RNA polymerase-binding regulatory protein [Alkalicoccus luteus]NJP38299.1 Spx/MgsR family RNA polymerase-binding regulatory protein [Alkalicoccus luteus]
MSMTFYHYPKCTTCKKAKKWLEGEGVELEEVHIAENPPSKDELKQLHEQSGLPLKRFFNTSGQKYRELGLKDKLSDMSEEEQLELLASDGMLIKRPIAAANGKVTVGFREADYEKTWK